MKFRLGWHDTETGTAGHGEVSPLSVINRVIEWANKRYPLIDHWLEVEIR